MITLNIGDKVIYDSAAGRGVPAEVVGIKEGKNAAGDTIDWLCFKILVDRKGNKLKYPRFVHLAYTAQNLAMMKVRKA